MSDSVVLKVNDKILCAPKEEEEVSQGKERHELTYSGSTLPLSSSLLWSFILTYLGLHEMSKDPKSYKLNL